MSTCSIDLIAKDEGGGGTGPYSGVAPAFGALRALTGGDAVLQSHLDNAEAMHNASYFVDQGQFCTAMALYAAHTLAQAYPQVALGSGTGTGAAASSLKAGDLAITYGATAMGGVAGSGDDLDSTPWGQRYKRIVRNLRRHPRYYSGRG